jgi:murein L,D-transpeptidase YafK
MSVARAALVMVGLAATLALAGCKSEQATVASRPTPQLSAATVALMTEKGMSRQDPILLRIYKEESKAEIWKKRSSDGRYALLKSYDICRFSGKLGPKKKEGDKQAPEGFYSVSPAQMNPRSNYFLSFNIGYPNAYDRALGRSGTHVMMHGDCLSAGCYAMTDAQIGEIYALAQNAFAGGQKAFQVQALPFRMTAQNMARRRNNENIAFWKNLKQGSDHFEVTKLEPKVDACGKKYVFDGQPGPLSTFEPTAACPAYQVEPQIAKAVAARQRADDILIAQLSKKEQPAPEYVAQDGRMRRKLDEPIVMLAAISPIPGQPGPAAAATAAQPELEATGSATARPVVRQSVAMASAAPVALTTPAPTSDGQPTTKVEGGFFAQMFASAKPEPAPVEGPIAVVAAARPVVPVPVAKSAAARKPGEGPREIAVDQAPVMASSVGPAPAAKPSGVGGWLKGMFGGASEPAPEAAQPTVTPAAASSAPPADPAKKRSAEAQPKKPNARVASTFLSYQGSEASVRP